MNTIGSGFLFSFFALWPIYYSAVALVILRKKLAHKLNFSILVVLSCYGLDVCVRGLGRRALNVTGEASRSSINLLNFLSWILAIFLIYWLYKHYGSKRT